jgi:putative transcriptional regulator
MSRFADIRRVLALTQVEMAEILGCTQSNVSFLDRGQTITPDVAKKLVDAAALLGVKLTLDHVYGDGVLPLPRVVGQASRLQPHDWPRITAELRRRGWSVLQLAAHLGVGVAEVAKLFDGDEDDPRHALGAALLDLHRSGSRPAARTAAKVA